MLVVFSDLGLAIADAALRVLPGSPRTVIARVSGTIDAARIAAHSASSKRNQASTSAGAIRRRRSGIDIQAAGWPSLTSTGADRPPRRS